jgi:hypothetical protein
MANNGSLPGASYGDRFTALQNTAGLGAQAAKRVFRAESVGTDRIFRIANRAAIHRLGESVPRGFW